MQLRSCAALVIEPEMQCKDAELPQKVEGQFHSGSNHPSEVDQAPRTRTNYTHPRDSKHEAAISSDPQKHVSPSLTLALALATFPSLNALPCFSGEIAGVCFNDLMQFPHQENANPNSAIFGPRTSSSGANMTVDDQSPHSVRVWGADESSGLRQKD
ncbi:hypothetical protein Dda_5195 [Drechslerella dactyloides]|uniref:Uncharacterized protein n=1 Tax=Drechslerella dactyloides TaxID=74499 RepID=A0AAD6IVT8_DREDA|nr:hypothetical protein Dda_5195 [Drechslerella dactyloides]